MKFKSTAYSSLDDKNFLVDSERKLFLIADCKNNSKLARKAIDYFSYFINSNKDELETLELAQASIVCDYFARAINHTNLKLFRDEENEGISLTAIMIVGTRLAISHVGTTRAYLIRNSKLFRLTSDHSIGYEFKQRGLISEEEFKFGLERKIPYKNLGIYEKVNAEHIVLESKSSDVIAILNENMVECIDFNGFKEKFSHEVLENFYSFNEYLNENILDNLSQVQTFLLTEISYESLNEKLEKRSRFNKQCMNCIKHVPIFENSKLVELASLRQISKSIQIASGESIVNCGRIN